MTQFVPPSRRSVKVGLLGLGVVGGALYDLAVNVRPIEGIEIKSVAVRNPAAHRLELDGRSGVTQDWRDVLGDDEIEIIVEAIGNPLGDATQDFNSLAQALLRAVEQGKTLVTANKRFVATHWSQLIRLARKSGSSIYFEACVGGSIPIIAPLRARQHLEEVTEIVGIVNATSNFVLTRMAEGVTLKDALMEAVDRGLAEPGTVAESSSDDLNGTDARYKIAILASIAFQTWVDPSSITFQDGIDNLGVDFFRFASQYGYVVKPIAVARLLGDYSERRLDTGVYPALLTKEHSVARDIHPLASVDRDYNGILVRGSFSGWHMFSGRGAGQPTATAMYGDLLQAVKNIRLHVQDIPEMSEDDWTVVPRRGVERPGYIHALTPHKPGQLAALAAILGDRGINISQLNGVEAVSAPDDDTLSWVGDWRSLMLSVDAIPIHEIDLAVSSMRTAGFRQVHYVPIEPWTEQIGSLNWRRRSG